MLDWLFGRTKPTASVSVSIKQSNERLTSNKDWKNSPAHLLLLSKFFIGSSIDHFANTDYWTPVLNEQPTIAIKRFISENMLELLDIETCLHLKFNIPDLKVLLKERRLKVSGNKTVLVDRLLENDRPGMEKIVAESGMYKCSPSGASYASEYLTAQVEKKKRFEQEVLSLLNDHKYKKALRAVGAFESSQVFSRGVGMDWNYYGSDEDVLELTAIFEKTPAILNGISEDRLGPLRLAAGMIHLLGTNKTSSWLPVGYETGIRFDADIAARMILSCGSYLRRMHQLSDKDLTGFIKEVEFSCIDNDDSCSACRKMSGRKYKISKFPELPYSKCTSKMGCRCSVFAVFDQK